MQPSRDFPDKLPFRVEKPIGEVKPFLFNSPHSGRHYPPAFLQMSCLDSFDIRLSEDRFVDEIFASAPHYGATLMVADFPRAYIDVNRGAFELDPSMFSEPLPSFVPEPTLRVEAGFGSVARLVGAGKPIYAHQLPPSEALERIYTVYQPYHQRLAEELQLLRQNHDLAILIDCHSMPGKPRHLSGQNWPDIILGDAYGKACAPALTDYAEKLLLEFGYHVVRNHPYAGGYITSHYGQPNNNIHALQIEINRDLYLDPHCLEKNSGFATLVANMSGFTQQLMMLDYEAFWQHKNAAE